MRCRSRIILFIFRLQAVAAARQSARSDAARASAARSGGTNADPAACRLAVGRRRPGAARHGPTRLGPRRPCVCPRPRFDRLTRLPWHPAPGRLTAGARRARGALDQRGAGAGLPLARRFYHAGRSEDLRTVLEEVHRWCPLSPLLLAGVSLGGNVSLKLTAEAAGRAVPGLAHVAVIAPPIDLESCAVLLSHRRNRIYESHFVSELIVDAEKRQKHFPDLPPLRFPRRMTVRLFDDLYTAPRSGFRGLCRLLSPLLLRAAHRAHHSPHADFDGARRSVHRGGAVRATDAAAERDTAHPAEGRPHRFSGPRRPRRHPLGGTARRRMVVTGVNRPHAN